MEAAELWDKMQNVRHPRRSLVSRAVVMREFLRQFPNGAANAYLKLLQAPGASARAFAGFCLLSVK